MPEAPSLLSYAAAAIYALVIVSSLSAAYFSRTRRQQQWHFKIWALIAGLFVALIILRVFNLEEMLRADLRGWLQSEGMIAERRSVQGVAVAGAIIAFTAAGMFAAYWLARRIQGRRNIATVVAGASGIVMLVIMALRTISLHAMDRLLYGPLKLNWIGDLGASGAVIAAAAYYIWLIRERKSVRKR